MLVVLFQIINLLITVLTWLVIIKVVLSYFMSPFHPLRATIDRIVEPMLEPIRRIMPRTGMIDFSPLVLIILLQVLEIVLRNLLFSL
ncbi:MAG TPA: YggT family protein [Anaerolineales bacterium]|jgi:YggT family protein|nr:YggT family protein [Anaerolineales bacterium]